MEQNKEWDEVFNLGVEAGIKQMMDKIQHQCSIGKPILANGELYWLKDCKQNLIDIMEDIDREHGIEKEDYESGNTEDRN